MLHIKEFPSEEAKNAFSNAVHWGYGTAWGAARGFIGAVGLTGVPALLAHFAAVWGAEVVMLPSLGVAKPITEWGGEEIAVDVFHHLVYVTATSLAYAVLVEA